MMSRLMLFMFAGLACGQSLCQVSAPGKDQLYTRHLGKKIYEITDHLGNVRSIVSDIKVSSIVNQAPANFKAIVNGASQYYPYGMIMPYWLDSNSAIYMATLEDQEASREQADFGASYAQAEKVSNTLFNHTEEILANKSLRLSGTGQGMAGLSKSLQVKGGDTVRLEIYTKYPASAQNAPSAQMVQQILTVLTPQLGITPAVDGGKAYHALNELVAGNQLFQANGNDGEVKSYLNYLLFDENYVLMDAGYQRVTSAAEEDGLDMSHEKLELEVIVNQAGYLYAYLSNESEHLMEVYFDDFKITHVTSILSGAQPSYRFGFNTQEKMDELSGTGNHTTALFWEYDTRTVQRWNQDPKSSAEWSPYSILAGNPISNVDIHGDTVSIQGMATVKINATGTLDNQELCKRTQGLPYYKLTFGSFHNFLNRAEKETDGLLASPKAWLYGKSFVEKEEYIFDEEVQEEILALYNFDPILDKEQLNAGTYFMVNYPKAIEDASVRREIIHYGSGASPFGEIGVAFDREEFGYFLWGMALAHAGGADFYWDRFSGWLFSDGPSINPPQFVSQPLRIQKVNDQLLEKNENLRKAILTGYRYHGDLMDSSERTGPYSTVLDVTFSRSPRWCMEFLSKQQK